MVSLLEDTVPAKQTLHNAHVIKWYRWQIWMAKELGRPWAQTVLIQWHNEELDRSYL